MVRPATEVEGRRQRCQRQRHGTHVSGAAGACVCFLLSQSSLAAWQARVQRQRSAIPRPRLHFLPGSVTWSGRCRAARLGAPCSFPSPPSCPQTCREAPSLAPAHGSLSTLPLAAPAGGPDLLLQPGCPHGRPNCLLQQRVAAACRQAWGSFPWRSRGGAAADVSRCCGTWRLPRRAPCAAVSCSRRAEQPQRLVHSHFSKQHASGAALESCTQAAPCSTPGAPIRHKHVSRNATIHLNLRPNPHTSCFLHIHVYTHTCHG